MAEAVVTRTPIGAGVRKRRWSRKTIDDNIAGYLFMAPWVIGFIAFTVGPMIASGYLSLTKYSGFGPVKWVGFENYDKIFQDDLFYTSLYNTAYYAFLGVPAQLLVALYLAVLLNMKVPYVNVFRTVYYIPTVTPAVANVFLWVWIFNFDFGLINSLLRVVNIAPVNWLWDPQVVKPALILMSLWSVGQMMIIFLAALQGVPPELLEAASIDGASGFRRFLRITVPLISPVIFLNLIIGIINLFPNLYGGLYCHQRRTHQLIALLCALYLSQGLRELCNGVCIGIGLDSLYDYPGDYCRAVLYFATLGLL